jgi:hypothetical protein
MFQWDNDPDDGFESCERVGFDPDWGGFTGDSDRGHSSP